MCEPWELVGVTRERYEKLVRENARAPTIPCQPPGARKPCDRCIYHGTPVQTLDPVAAMLGGPVGVTDYPLPAECRWSLDRSALAVPRSRARKRS